jgi:NAD(P)-dependent dehydrogenase (short-subunit alcohol dehydrogenase family)
MSAGGGWLQLANRTAIITGASNGIGRAVAQTLYDAGCHLVLADIQRPSTAMAATDFHPIEPTNTTADPPPSSSRHGATVRNISCDVTQRDQVDRLMDVALNSLDDNNSVSSPPSPPPASILVNCAGVTRDSRVEAMSEQEWDTVINVNLKGTFNMCQSFLQHWSKHVLCTSPASIINIGSVAAQQGNYGQVNYAASKGGIVGMSKALAKEVARRNVRVNVVLPGFINTSMAQKVPDHILTKIVQKIPIQRMGRPEEVANVIAFLASDRSSYITGATIECSGMIAL